MHWHLSWWEISIPVPRLLVQSVLATSESQWGIFSTRLYSTVKRKINCRKVRIFATCLRQFTRYAGPVEIESMPLSSH